MRKFSSIYLSLFVSLQFLASCRFRTGAELTKFNKFEFSYRNPSTSKYFSLLFTQSDTIFLKKYEPNNQDSLFFSVLPAGQRFHIDDFVTRLDSLDLGPLNDLNLRLGWFIIYLDFGIERQKIGIPDLHPSAEVKKFTEWVNKMMDSLSFVFSNKKLTFNEEQTIHEMIEKNSR